MEDVPVIAGCFARCDCITPSEGQRVQGSSFPLIFPGEINITARCVCTEPRCAGCVYTLSAGESETPRRDCEAKKKFMVLVKLESS